MFSWCVGEAVVELFVDVSLDSGDLFLFQWFGDGGLLQAVRVGKWVYSFVGRGWIGVERVGNAVVVLN